MDGGKIDLYVAIEYQYNSNIKKVGILVLQPLPMLLHANAKCHFITQIESERNVCNNMLPYIQK